MPITVPEQFGTNKVGNKNQDYCCYCFQEGDFTQYVSMDEMIVLCANYTDDWSAQGGSTISREEAIALMKKDFPKLKRWLRKQATEDEYHRSVNRAIDHINKYLHQAIDLEELAQVANISPFHFHRIFKSIIGENVGEYIQRLRMENAAQKLRTTTLSLIDIAEHIGYQTPQAFSKAFKKHFGCAPSNYRNSSGVIGICQQPEPVAMKISAPEIRMINDMRCIYIRIVDVYGSPKSYNRAWGKLYGFAQRNNMINNNTEYIGISFDDPTITSPNRCRFYACITTGGKPIKSQGEIGVQTIEGGQFAVFTLKGSYNGLMEMYHAIYLQWLPSSNYKLRNSMSFEKYLNSPENVNTDNLLTEIYIPVE